jgi:hypothetical protein
MVQIDEAKETVGGVGGMGLDLAPMLWQQVRTRKGCFGRH